MSNKVYKDKFNCVLELNGNVQNIVIQTSLDEKEEECYHAVFPSGRKIDLELNLDDELWHIKGGRLTDESEAIGRLIDSRYE